MCNIYSSELVRELQPPFNKKKSQFIHNLAALFYTQTALNRIQLLCSHLIFVHGIQQQLHFQKDTQNKCLISKCLTVLPTLESKLRNP